MSARSPVLIINRGRLLYDGALDALVARTVRVKRLELVLGGSVTRNALESFGTVKHFQFPNATLEVPREEATAASARLLATLPIADLSVQDPPLEEVIRTVFEEQPVAASAIA
jgi:ABC-2 type transport system ATP-binding protein